MSDRVRVSIEERVAVVEAILRLMDRWNEVGSAVATCENRQEALGVLTRSP